MNCPSCHQTQPDGGTECQACGVIFAKWKAAQSAAMMRPPSQASASSSESGPSLQWGGAIMGTIVAMILSLIASNIVAAHFMTSLPKTADEAGAAMKALMLLPPYLWSDLAASALCMAVGGYMAAGSPGSSGVKQGLGAGVLLTCIVGAMSLASAHMTPGWYNAAAVATVIPAAALGGMLR